MPDEPSQGTPSTPTPSSSPTRPAPPPYRPNKDLIGYIEKGLKPPTRPVPPTEGR
jgi:hypothetical protein